MIPRNLIGVFTPSYQLLTPKISPEFCFGPSGFSQTSGLFTPSRLSTPSGFYQYSISEVVLGLGEVGIIAPGFAFETYFHVTEKTGNIPLFALPVSSFLASITLFSAMIFFMDGISHIYGGWTPGDWDGTTFPGIIWENMKKS